MANKIPSDCYHRAIDAIASLAAVVVLLAGCDATAPLPPGAKPIQPLANYGRWWSMVETCSGVGRSMGDITWYSVAGNRIETSSGYVTGLYRVRSDELILADAYLLDGPTVRHEMLHAILDRESMPHHPREYFIEKCAGVVSCNVPCVQSSDPPPNFSGVEVESTPAALELSVVIDSARFSASNYGGLGYTSVTVRARNTTSNYIRVAPGPRWSGEPQDPRLTFGMRFRGVATLMTHEVLSADPATHLRFAPGETRTHVFDFYAPKGDQSIGPWLAEPAFGGRYSTAKSFEVVR